MKTRKIGTVTAGLGIAVCGIVFLLYTLLPGRDVLRYALLFWPVFLVALGLEIVLTSRFGKTERKIDFGSLILMFLCIGFAFFCEAFRLTSGSF